MPITRLFDILDHQFSHTPKADCIATKENGEWRPYSTEQVLETSEYLAMGLMALGIQPGDKVAMASGNRSEWCLLDQALLRIGAINVPLYPTSSATDYAYVLMPNAALLGGFAAISGQLQFESVAKAIREKFPGKVGEANVTAARAAYDSAIGQRTQEPAHA